MALGKKAAKRVADFLITRMGSITTNNQIANFVQAMGRAAGKDKSFQKSLKRVCKALAKPRKAAKSGNLVRTKLSKKAS